MDKMLGGLFGTQNDDNAVNQQARARDFVNRYETGLPHEGYSDDEAVHNYRQVASNLSPRQYEDAAGETFGRMSKEQRKELRREMKQRSGGRFSVDSDDPREMARATAQYHQQDQSGGGLAGLFGMGGGQPQQQQEGGLGGMLGGLLGGGQSQQQGGGQPQQQQGGGLLDNPLAKVAMGGIAAMAMKKMIGGR